MNENLFACGAIALWMLCLVRDLERRVRLKAVAIVSPILAFGIVGGITRSVDGLSSFSLGVGCLFLAFVIVTRGHVLRAIDRDVDFVDERVRKKYMNHVRLHQWLGIVLGLASWVVSAVVLSY